MKQWMTVVPAAAVAVVASAVVALTLDDPSSSESALAPAGLVQADPDTDDAEDGGERAEGHGRGLGHHLKLGPPAWVQRRVHVKDDSWKRAWQHLAPAQREQVMERLAREHREGMRAWTRCVADGPSTLGNACERPLPPGIAKRDPAELG